MLPLRSSLALTAKNTLHNALKFRSYGETASLRMPMKQGTILKSLGVTKGQDPPVVKSREEYPEWMGDLAKPMPSLAALRRMANEEAEDTDIMRYLKLTRRQRIQQRNEQASVK